MPLVTLIAATTPQKDTAAPPSDSTPTSSQSKTPVTTPQQGSAALDEQLQTNASSSSTPSTAGNSTLRCPRRIQTTLVPAMAPNDSVQKVHEDSISTKQIVSRFAFFEFVL